MYRFKVDNVYTRVIPKLPIELINKIFCCQSFSFGYFDYATRRRTSYPVKKIHDWCFYNHLQDMFSSGFLSTVVRELGEENCEIEYIAVKPERQFDFSWTWDKFLKDNNIEVRYFQEEATKMVMIYCNGVLEIGTGGGKTITYGNIIQYLGVKTLLITIDNTSRQQLYEDMCNMFGEDSVGLIDDENFDEYPIVVANIQNIWAKLKSNHSEFMLYKDTVQLLIVNESHHLNESKVGNDMENTWANAVMQIPAFYRVGATGTVGKEGGLQAMLLKGAIGDIIYKKSTKELIQEGFATPIEVHVYTIKVNNDEHSKSVKAYQNLMDDENFIDMIAKLAYHYGVNLKLKTVVFCEWVEKQVFRIADKLKGYSEVIHGGIKNGEDRSKIFKDFADGKFPIMIGTIFNEDINIPAMDAGIIIGKKKNERTVKQRTGRMARLFKGKTKGYVIYPYIQDFKKKEVIDKNGIKRIKLVDGILAKHSKEGLEILQEEGHTIIYKEIEDIKYCI